MYKVLHPQLTVKHRWHVWLWPVSSVALSRRHTLAPGGPGLFVGPPCVLLQQYYFGYGVFYLSKRAPFNIDNCSPGRHPTIQLSIQLSCSLQVADSGLLHICWSLKDTMTSQYLSNPYLIFSYFHQKPKYISNTSAATAKSPIIPRCYSATSLFDTRSKRARKFIGKLLSSFV